MTGRLRVAAEEDHLAITQGGHLDDQRVVGIEHGGAVGQHDIDLRAQYVGEHVPSGRWMENSRVKCRSD